MNAKNVDWFGVGLAIVAAIMFAAVVVVHYLPPSTHSRDIGVGALIAILVGIGYHFGALTYLTVRRYHE